MCPPKTNWSGSPLTPTRTPTCSCARLELAKASVRTAKLMHTTLVFMAGVSVAESRGDSDANDRCASDHTKRHTHLCFSLTVPAEEPWAGYAECQPACNATLLHRVVAWHGTREGQPWRATATEETLCVQSGRGRRAVTGLNGRARPARKKIVCFT